MKKLYTICLMITFLIISQQAFPQKENIKVALTGEQQIEVSEGFSFVSSRFNPDNPDMEEVVEEILNDDFQYVRNSIGAMLRKIGPNWVNGIGDWIGIEGYLIKTNVTGQFTIEGTLIPQDTPIELLAGFQFVSYLPANEMDALEAFSSIIGDNLLYVRNSVGYMLRKIGPNWVNGIGNCNPGEGYLVKMNADDVLIYPGSSFTCGDPFTDPRDEKTYATVQIGDQCWMAENLNIGEMINGSENMTDNGIIEKYCYDNDPANCETYGGLYQWNEMMEYTTTPGTQGICPSGWHLPTDGEWSVLTDFLGGESIAGGKMKETGTTHWSSPNTGATNESGFTALPGGIRSSDSHYYYLTQKAYYWSSNEYDSSGAWRRTLHRDTEEVSRNHQNKGDGFSVRCVQD